MESDVPGVRPRSFEPGETERFHELRSFRHVFRNVYRARLKADRVLEVQRQVSEAVSVFRRAHARFREALEAIAARLDGELP